MMMFRLRLLQAMIRHLSGLQDPPYKNLTEPTYNLPFIFRSSANKLKNLSNIRQGFSNCPLLKSKFKAPN